MAESGLSIDLTGLRNAVCQYLGFGLTYASASTDEQTLIDRQVDQGLRSFYQPTPLQGERISHIWSFMQPEFNCSIAPDTDAVDLPDDFGGFTGSLYLSSDDLGWEPLKLTGIGQVLKERQLAGGTAGVTGAPRLLAVMPIATNGSSGQRYSLQFWPSADAAYTIKGIYYCNPYQLGTSTPYPMGGQPHAETLREACLAVAEREVNDVVGVHSQTFERRLAASVCLDRRLSSPQSFGMNSDKGVNRRPTLWRSGYTTYNDQFEPPAN